MVKILLTPDDRTITVESATDEVPAVTQAKGEQTVATTTVQPAASAPAVVKESWLKRVGHVVGRILGIVAKDAAPVADVAAKVAEALLPQFSGQIQVADNLITNIAKEAIAAEGLAAVSATAVGGPAKLTAVVANIGPALDQWVAANFPGAAAVGSAEKAGLVNAVVAIINKIEAAPTA